MVVTYVFVGVGGYSCGSAVSGVRPLALAAVVEIGDSVCSLMGGIAVD